MILGKVIARTVSSAKSERLPSDRQLLTVDPLEGFGKGRLVAIDTVQAGPGDTVVVMAEGTGARQAVGTDTPMPAQMVVIGIVDRIDSPLA